MSKQILIVGPRDDTKAITAFLKKSGYEIFSVSTRLEAIEVLNQNPLLNLVLVNDKIEGPTNAVQLIIDIKRSFAGVAVVFMFDQESQGTAVHAIVAGRAGAMIWIKNTGLPRLKDILAGIRKPIGGATPA